MNKNKKMVLRILTIISTVFFIAFVLFFSFTAKLSLAQSSGAITIFASVSPVDATSFVATDAGPGLGECSLTWTTSTTPNIETIRIEIDDGISLITKDLTPTPGPYFVPSTPDDYKNYAPFTNVDGLITGWPYIFRHVSIADGLQSPGVWATCTPSSALPTPVLNPEPATTVGTTNTLYWTNGGIDDVTMECNIQISTTDLNIDPLTFIGESGWLPCPDSATTYEYEFTGLAIGVEYFYHVQSRTPADGLSPFSNVESSTQVASTVAAPPRSVAGGRPPRVIVECGDGIVAGGEQCDDGNLINGDGCSEFCLIEVPLKPAAQECGNGIVETGEQCDDGNTVSGDGCDGACQLEEEIVEVIFNIRAEPEYRVPHPGHPNLSLNAAMGVFKPSIGSLDTVQVVLDDEGFGKYTSQIVIGSYDFALNGEAHNTKIISGINITPSTTEVDLDFTLAGTWELTAGDTYDSNYVNAQDIAVMLSSYRVQGRNVSDLNKDINPRVNAQDIAILIWNYKKEGEYFRVL